MWFKTDTVSQKFWGFFPFVNGLTYDMYLMIRHLQVFKITIVIPQSITTSYVLLLLFMFQPRCILMAMMKFCRYSVLFTVAVWPIQQLVLLLFLLPCPTSSFLCPFLCLFLAMQSCPILELVLNHN